MFTTSRSLVSGAGAAALLGGALLAAAAIPAHAADGTSGPGVKFWTEGTMKPGAVLDVYADCGYAKSGKVVTAATVSGPAGMSATLTPMADRGYLGGMITVPKSYAQSTAVLKVTCDNMATATTTLRAAATAPAPKVKPSNAPVRVVPKGAPQTGGGPEATQDSSLAPIVLTGLGAAGVVGAGSIVLRRRAENR